MASLDALLDGMSNRLYGRTRSDAVGSMTCVRCVVDIREDCPSWSRADWNEYRLSALCPSCATEVFAMLDDPDE